MIQDDYNISRYGNWLTGTTSRGDFCMYPQNYLDNPAIEFEVCGDDAYIYTWCKNDIGTYKVFVNGESRGTMHLTKQRSEYFEHYLSLQYEDLQYENTERKHFNVKIVPLDDGVAITGVRILTASKIL